MYTLTIRLIYCKGLSDVETRKKVKIVRKCEIGHLFRIGYLFRIGCSNSYLPLTTVWGSCTGHLLLSYQTLIVIENCLSGKKVKMNSKKPSPPDSLPKYIIEGVPKQDNESLRDLQAWIDDIVDYRNDISAEDIEADEGEKIEEVDDSGTKTKVIKKVPCGKDACSTCPHGPYLYFCWREGDKVVWEYEGPVNNR